jgi:Trypsin-co-occurring domain 1
MERESIMIVEAQVTPDIVISVEAVANAVADSARPGAFDFNSVATEIGGLAGAIARPIAELRPTRATVEFGCSLWAQAGQLTALLINGSADASIKVTLEWENQDAFRDTFRGA